MDAGAHASQRQPECSFSVQSRRTTDVRSRDKRALRPVGMAWHREIGIGEIAWLHVLPMPSDHESSE
jgi:hypothetical protein